MDKLAVFAEGQTEQTFVEALIYAIAGRHRVHIDTATARGGRLFPRKMIEVNASGPDANTQYFVIIYASANDSRVLSDIIDRYNGLLQEGYREVIGLHDLTPLGRSDEGEVRANFASHSPRGRLPVTHVLAVMEIEAWLIAEHTHFYHVSRTLVPPVVSGVLGYDPATVDVQQILSPSSDLRQAYSAANLGYRKSRDHAERTVNSLDLARIYVEIVNRLPDVATLVESIDRFLS